MDALVTSPAPSSSQPSTDFWEPKRALTLDAARAHSRRVRLFRGALLGLAVLLLAVLIWQFTSRQTAFDPVDNPGEAVKMVSPRYLGRTDDGLPYVLTADEAVRRRDDPDTVILINPFLEFVRMAGAPPSKIVARDGAYDDVTSELDLRRKVVLDTDDGTVCNTEHARIFLTAKRITGNEPIVCTGGFGRITGNTYRIEDAYETYVFESGMTARLDNQGRPAAAQDRP